VFSGKRPVSVTAAARNCGMGRSAFGTLFSRLMGISFPEFGLRYRLSGAAAQLARTDAPLKAVALDWGFTDASHLHRTFCRRYGCTPADYRKRVLEH